VAVVDAAGSGLAGLLAGGGLGEDVAEFRLLGPVEVWGAGRLIDAGQPRQRCVLAALLVDAGRLVTWETLVDRVWGQDPPAAARNSLYSHITRIRQLLRRAEAPGDGARLERRPGGYLLVVDPDRVDLHRFRRIVDEVRSPRLSDQERVTRLREALDLWRGEPMAGLAGDWAARIRELCHNQRLHAVAVWAEAEVRVGNPHVVVEPLTTLLDAYPLAEPLAVGLMRALQAAGHTTDALDCYRRMRERLAEELGTDPGPELRQLHQAILRGDLDRQLAGAGSPPRPAGRDGPAEASGAEPARQPVAAPAQLPLAPPGFAGRHAELARLDGLTAGRQAPVMTIAAILGTAGVGKTALALHWAHRVTGEFPDGQLYVNLRGFEPAASPVDPGEAVRGFLDALGVAPQRIPTTLAGQSALYRSLVASRRVLVVLDNARDPEQVRPLLPGGPGCFVVVTSRDQLAGLVSAEGAHPITLDLLTVTEARHVLDGRLGSGRLAGAMAAVEDLVESCARLPLALVIMAARIASRPGAPLDALASELRRDRPRLDQFSGRDAATDVRTVFSWSYQALSEGAARLFRLLGLHPGPDLTVDVAACLAAAPPPAARELMAELLGAHLLTEHRPGRFTLHDLLRAYAAELVHSEESDAERAAGRDRLFDHYLHTAHAADQLLNPRRDPISLGQLRPGADRVAITDKDHALAWFLAEQQVLLAAVGQAAELGCADHAWRLAWAMSTFLERQGHWHSWANAEQTALAAARQVGDRVGQVESHRAIAGAYVWLDRYQDARAHLTAALALADDLADRASQAHIRLDLAWTCERQGRHREVLDHAEQALDRYRAERHLAGQARALNTIGWAHALLGDYQETLGHCERALDLLQRLGDRSGAAHTWDSLGYAHRHRRDHHQAVACYRHAIELFHDLGERYYLANSLESLGDAYHAGGDLAAARDAWRRALIILDQLGHQGAQQVRAKLGRDPAGQSAPGPVHLTAGG
jgi:DNA-binding SARP family transcriptional activator/tetratricopeptide (TPR) repeat protein